MNLELEDKHILVTGSSGGIGSVIVKMLLEDGCIVSGTDLKELNSADYKDSNKFHFVRANLDTESNVKTLFDSVTAERGRIDAIILSHGFWYPDYQSIKDLDMERWNKVLSNNLTASVLCVKYFFQNLEKYPEKQASVVFLGSTAGMYGLPGFYEYVSAKSALLGLMKSLKAEIVNYASEGRVNMISPSIVNTSMSEKFRANKDLVKKNLQVSALKKIAEPEDVASIAVVLTSPKASKFVTGENLLIAGGIEGRVIHDFDKINVD